MYMAKAWMVHAGKNELQVPLYVLYQHSIYCCSTLVQLLCYSSFISSKGYYIWIWELQDWEVDQEIDGKMRWERMEEYLVEKG